MKKNLYRTKDANRNKDLVDSIKSGLIELGNETGKLSMNEIEIMVDIVEKILDFNKRYQERQGLKILTPNQMLSRLKISLAQLESGKNSEKLKNEIRQLLYSLYNIFFSRTEKLFKTIYNDLINTI